MVNHLVFQGRTVEPPKCGQTNSGVAYANFRLAWSEKYKEKENKCFLNCKAFGATAEFISKFFSDKGMEMVAEGKLNTETWEKDGQQRNTTVLMVSDVHFCGPKRQELGQVQQTQPNFTPVDPDGLPF